MTHPDDDAFLRAIDADPHNQGRVYDVLLQWCDYLQETGRELEAEGIRNGVTVRKLKANYVSGYWWFWHPKGYIGNNSVLLFKSCSAAWADLGAAYARMIEMRRWQNDPERKTMWSPLEAAT